MKKILLTFIIVFTLFIGMFWMASQQMKSAQNKLPGSAFTGVTAVLATSSTIQVGPGTNKNIIFAENSTCTSRVISTGANAIMLSFTSLQTNTATSTTNPGPTIGFQQLASTTVAYDSGIYGCPAVSAYGYTASTTVTVAEFR